MKKSLLCIVTVLVISFQLAIVNSSAQPQLWGMTQTGGQDNMGVIFKADSSANSETVQHSFLNTYQGANPHYSDMMQATDGMLYGMTKMGGVNNMGVIFQYNTATGTYNKKFDFNGTPNGNMPYGALIQATDGMLYGMTSAGGANDKGVIFQFNPVTNIYTKKLDFNGTANGWSPMGSLMQATDGMLYGTTFQGGINGEGVLFQFDPSTNIYTKKIDLIYANGRYSYGSLIQATDGMLYGTASNGGANSVGVIFQYNPITSIYTKKLDFNGTANGSQPYGSLMQASDGMLYGMTTQGGINNAGVIFQYDPVSSTYTKKLDFNATANGATPFSSLRQASDGMLYGMTMQGGLNSCGVIFQYNFVTSIYTKKFDFSTAPNGRNPYGSLMEATDGMLYGMTYFGGSKNVGIIFQYNPATTIFTKKIDFNSGSNGSSPQGSLMQAYDGKLYGMTNNGGANDVGVVFQYDPATTTYAKKIDLSATNGSYPYGSLIQASDGMLYGMTSQGGATSVGVLFQYDPVANIYTKKFDFDVDNGSYPYASLLQASNGMLYGVTSQGGSYGTGVLFQYDPITSVYTKKFDFISSSGSNPYGSLMQASDGKLYGMTMQGGSGGGALFQYDPAINAYTKKLNFYSAHGVSPTGSLMQASDGKIYGMTYSGGGNNGGVLFQYDPATNAYLKKFDFDVTGKGNNPFGSLMQASDGMLYGMTSSGGVNSVGVIFQFNPATNTYTKKLDFNGPIGSAPQYANLIDLSVSLSTSTLANSICAGSSINVPFINTGVYNTGNIFTAQLSDASGSFASPATIGTLLSSTTSGTINALVPLNSPLGAAYRIRVVSSSPATIGKDNGSNITINPYLNVTANASTSDSVCAGTSVILTGGGATTYTWTGNVTDGIGFVPYSTVIYTVIGTDGNGCTNTATKTITVSSLPTVFAYATATTVCAGSLITLAGLGNATSYTWTGGVTDGLEFLPTSTTYTLTGTDDNGCFSTAIKTIVVNPSPTVIANASVDSVCLGASVILSGSGNAVAYNWSGGVTDGIGIIPSSSATYTVTGTASNGCTASAIQTITVNALPIVFASASATIVCSGTLVTLSGVGNATSYSWSGGVTDGQAFVPSSAVYTVTGTDGNSCVNTAAKTITVLPNTSSSQSPTVCAGNSVTIGSNTYNTSGTYTDVLTSFNGCDSTVTTNLTVNDVTVSVSNATLTATAIGGAYQWLDCNNGYAEIAGQTSQSFTAATGVSYSVIVSQNNCSDTSSCYITTTGIVENSFSSTINIYPNPFNFQTTISFSEEQKNTTIKIMDMLGKEIKLMSFTGKQLIIEKGEMESGIYFVQINTEEGTLSKKLIINK